MDKTTWLTAEIISSYDLNSMAKDAVMGLAQLALLVLGSTQTGVHGFGAAQTSSPSLSISIASGIIIQQAPADANPIGTFPADNTQIMQIGTAVAQDIALNVGSIPAGQEQWWLIEAKFQQTPTVRSTDPTLGQRPFYNSAMPTQPLNGINDQGGAISTVIAGQAIISAISGAAAAAGTAIAPQPSSGCVPLYLIKVASGQVTITTGQIQEAGPNAYAGYQAAPFITGLLNQHHLGTPGSAPQIDLTKEVTNILPFANLPVSNQSPLATGADGGDVEKGGYIPVEFESEVAPQGVYAGQVGDQCIVPGTGATYKCMVGGSTPGATTWTQTSGLTSACIDITGSWTIPYTPQAGNNTYFAYTAPGGNNTIDLLTPAAMNGTKHMYANEGTAPLYLQLPGGIACGGYAAGSIITVEPNDAISIAPTNGTLKIV